MIIITTEVTDTVEKVISYSIIPQDMGPRGVLPSNTYKFSDNEIPHGFYRNYEQYFIKDGMLYTAPNATLIM